jgi:hypothetical protein
MPRARLKPLPMPLERSREAVGSAIGGAVILILVLAVIPLLRTPQLVPRVTLVNATSYQVNVDATGAAHDGWVDLGSVPREREVSLEGVADEGREWTFRFTSAGVYAGEMILARADLERDHWRVNVPAGVVVPLQDAGLPASAS